MFLKVLCTLLLVSTSISLPSASVGLSDNSISLLANLQSTHYSVVKRSVDSIDYLRNKIIYIGEDLKKNAEVHFNNLAQDELEQLAPLQEACGFKEACLACLDSKQLITETAQNITSTLVEYFDKQKDEFNKTIDDFKSNLEEGALLSTVVYELYKDSVNFEANARNYYERIQKSIVYENDLLNKTVESTTATLVKYSIDSTITATDKLETIFYNIVECIDEALNH